MRKTWILITALIICAGLQTGCGGGEETAAPDEPKGPEGPKKVALTMLRAIDSGDGPTLAACYDCSPEDKEYMINTMPLQQIIHKLIDAGNKAYGEDAWLQASIKAKVGMAKVNLATANQTMQCEITGNTAKCIAKGIPNPLYLHQKDGKWLILPRPGQFPPMAMRGQTLNAMPDTIKAIEAIILKIGTNNLSADDICNEIRIIIKGQ
ncbi:MAG: hypothetical protein HN350_02410 [Phycisphaerales bacterium]|nr:hypothetical protein [Phycisphaerales bacterium]